MCVRVRVFVLMQLKFVIVAAVWEYFRATYILANCPVICFPYMLHVCFAYKGKERHPHTHSHTLTHTHTLLLMLSTNTGQHHRHLAFWVKVVPV